MSDVLDIMVDVEGDGPIPGDYSMISLGAVVVMAGLKRTFYAQFKPISDRWVPEALAVSGHTREETLTFPDPKTSMSAFDEWLQKQLQELQARRLMLISDNNGYDAMFVVWYFWHFLGKCPFGHSSTNLGSLYKGMVKDRRQNFKHLRKTKHTHHPVDDAIGNAEALLHMQQQMGLR